MTTKAKERFAQHSQIGMDNLFAGSSNEDLAKAHFKGWNWTAGKPEPDIGADLIIEIPTQAEIQGAAFAAQVRSGKKWKATERIKRASALRLKGSPLPAFMLFINRTTREVRWVNLEFLFDTEVSFRTGGDLVVPMSAANGFEVLSAAPPTGFLDAVYHAKKRGAMKAAGSLSTLAHAMQDHFQQIDPTLVVRPQFDGRHDVLVISARNEPVSVRIEVREPTARSMTAFREAFEWGRPARVEAREFVLSGSPLWDYFAQEKHLSKFEFRPDPVWQGRGTLTTHDDGQQRYTEVVDVQLTRGTLGGECSFVLCQGLLKLRIRMDANLASEVDVSIEYAVMRAWTMKQLPAAGRALQILECALAGAMMELQLTDFLQANIGPVKFQWCAVSAEVVDEQRFPLRAAAALVQLVSTQGWRVEGCPFAKATRSDMDRWLSGQQLLNSGCTKLPAFSFSVEFSERPSIGDGDTAFGTLLLNHTLDISLGGKLVGGMPAWIRFRNYHAAIEPTGVGDAWRMRCTPGEGATREYLAPSDQPPTE